MTFQGFGPNAMPFLKALGFHQSKEWFEDNRATYEDELKGPVGDLVEDLAAAFAKAKIPLKGDRKASVFRINRDVRFAKDKSPYKTHVGAVMSRSGAKNDLGLMYMHLDPTGSFSAAGFYSPEPEELGRLRGAMVRAPKAWKQVVAKLAKAKLPLSDEYAMTRAPRDFPDIEDPEIAAAVRLKSLICRRPIPGDLLGGPDLVKHLTAFAKDVLPLLEWGWAAIVDSR